MRNVTPAGMDRDELRRRTQGFADRIVRFCEALPETRGSTRIARQLIDSGTSIDANYRIAGRSRSRREFISQLAIVCEEADETVGWLELIDRLGWGRGAELKWLLAESRELLAIFSASRKTAWRNARSQITKS